MLVLIFTADVFLFVVIILIFNFIIFVSTHARITRFLVARMPRSRARCAADTAAPPVHHPQVPQQHVLVRKIETAFGHIAHVWSQAEVSGANMQIEIGLLLDREYADINIDSTNYEENNAPGS